MNKIAFIVVCIFTNVIAVGQDLRAIDSLSTISFEVKNFGISVEGTMCGLEGTIVFDEKSSQIVSIKSLVKAASISTGISMRDQHLRKEPYFDIAHFPEITFVSRRIRLIKPDNLWMTTGMLTIKNISLEITFPFKSTASSSDNYLFEGEFKINRNNFHIGSASLSLSDTVHVKFKIFATKEYESGRSLKALN